MSNDRLSSALIGNTHLLSEQRRRSQTLPSPTPAAESGGPPGSRAIYPAGPATKPRTLLDVLHVTAARYPTATALDDGRRVLDYATLLTEVDRFGERLANAGIGAGDRVGIRQPSGTVDLYLSILAVMAVGAAYVPVDLDDPEERVQLVWSEAGVCAVIDGDQGLTRSAGTRNGAGVRRPEADDDAWIIFTSGTTGVPKGVAVTHRSAAAFVDAEAELFLRDRPLGPGDRVLAGLSVAFDASCEEMWLAWRHGAALVPAPRALMKTGPDLAEWLVQRAVTVVSTVPTMAALWPVDALRTIRLLILGGEACPAALADRLATGEMEVWNTYGPTEATVVSCAARLVPGKPVRIGLPLDGWQLAVLHPEQGEPVAWGEVGELVIGGVGLARYLDADKDAEKFMPVPKLGWDRAYRSGDSVRADRSGLVFVGRADTQVKIRGHRVELTEIESVLMQLPGIAQAVVTTHTPQPDVVELVGYYRAAPDVSGPDRSQLYELLRRRLPGHMVPAYLEELAVIPLSPSGKADRRSLPSPSGPRFLGQVGPYRAPGTSLERAFAEELATVLRVDQVSVDSHLFHDLGVNSLLIAHFCAAVRERADLPPMSTKDVYLHPTIRDLAAAIPPAPVRPAEASDSVPVTRATTARYLGCGALQLLIVLAAIYLHERVLGHGFAWVEAADGAGAVYLRSLAFGSGEFLLLCGLPIAAKWLLIGRWTHRKIPIWGLTYVRFWVVKTLIRTNPLVLFVGTPIYTWYLRALGARIGRRVIILSSHVPVCTDLLTIGDDAVIRKESFFSGYRACAGRIETGAVTIGASAFVGERTVLDLDTSLGDNAQLGHTSSLYSGQAVPAGERWHGSPAERTVVDYLGVAPKVWGRTRMLRYGVLNLLAVLVLYLPAVTVLSDVLMSRLAGLHHGRLYQQVLVISAVAFFGSLAVGFALLVIVPRLLNRLLVPGRSYPLYGWHYSLHRTIRLLTNTKFYLQLVGDSSYVVSYLRAVGYRLPGVQQTGSNFGASMDHESPFLTSIGGGTMISDNVSFLNAEYSSTSFRLVPTSVGERCFFGNSIAYPAGGRTGENCLVATKAMVPLDGPVRNDVGLLGSPCFEIPRTVERDRRFDDLKTGPEFRRRLRAKNKHNIGTMALFLLVRWIPILVLITFLTAAWHVSDRVGGVLTTALTVATFLAGCVYFILVERATVAFRSLRPRTCSIYDPHFWRHERYWKLSAPFVAAFDGTPAKGLVWRLLGVHVGKRLFDDGCDITERSLAAIGDDCTLNVGSVIQCHSMEDGTFKSDRTVIGAECTLGVGAFVHYGVTLGSGTVLELDSFLMKGERTQQGSRWAGNPAAVLDHSQSGSSRWNHG